MSSSTVGSCSDAKAYAYGVKDGSQCTDSVNSMYLSLAPIRTTSYSPLWPMQYPGTSPKMLCASVLLRQARASSSNL